MSQKNDNDDASFEGLMNFSTAPPPPGDVHNARTVMAELPDELIASLKSAGTSLDPTGSLSAEAAKVTRRSHPFEDTTPVAAIASSPEAAVPPAAVPAVETFPSTVVVDAPRALAPEIEPEVPVASLSTVPPRPRRTFLRIFVVTTFCIVVVGVAVAIVVLRHRLHLH